VFLYLLKEATFKKFWYLTILSDQVIEKQINSKKQQRAERKMKRMKRN